MPRKPSAKSVASTILPKIIVTCEHGGNDVPSEFRALFKRDRLLSTHRGWDPGAMDLLQLWQEVHGETYASTVTRLVVDLNRSPDHPQVLGPRLQESDDATIARLFEKYYQPYRTMVESAIRRRIAGASRNSSLDAAVLHISFHTFTPVLRGQTRAVDIGLLFDPERSREQAFCSRWQSSLKRIFPRLCVCMNKPYKGTDDGFTTYLRTRFADSSYAGIELEVNQRLVRLPSWPRTAQRIIASLVASIAPLSMPQPHADAGAARTR